MSLVRKLTEAEVACIMAAVLRGNGGSLEQEELLRQTKAVSRDWQTAELHILLWRVIFQGKIALSADSEGRMQIHRPDEAGASVEQIEREWAARQPG